MGLTTKSHKKPNILQKISFPHSGLRFLIRPESRICRERIVKALVWPPGNPKRSIGSKFITSKTSLKCPLKGDCEVEKFVRRPVFECQGCQNSRGAKLSRQILNSGHLLPAALQTGLRVIGVVLLLVVLLFPVGCGTLDSNNP